jgi:hypothetical protein
MMHSHDDLGQKVSKRFVENHDLYNSCVNKVDDNIVLPTNNLALMLSDNASFY